MEDEFAVPMEQPKKVVKQAKKSYTIYIDEEENELNSVKVGVNGKIWQLKRGVDIPDVPEEVIEVLRNAKATRLVQSTNPITGLIDSKTQDFHRIPWRIVG